MVNKKYVLQKMYDCRKRLPTPTIFFRPLNAIKKQAVIANGVQRNEAICQVLAGFLLKLGRLLRRASSQ